MTGKTISVDAMGGDHAPEVVLDGIALFLGKRRDMKFILHGQADVLKAGIERRGLSAACEIRDCPDVVSMDAKPSAALRKSKGTSMWGMIDSVKTGEAQSGISAGNTGALMAFSMLALRRMSGVHRPAMTAIWPTIKGRTVVLDVGANLDADADQLVTYAVMGEAYMRAITGKAKPKVGLLNIGSEEEKGPDAVKLAAQILKTKDTGVDFYGYVEGNDISSGEVDVIVTDGFTGNVALKTAEGTARLVASYVRDALTSSLLSKAGATLASTGLKALKERMNPSNVNGGVLLGLNGVVVKSHGGADAAGYATALALAADLAASDYMSEVSKGLKRISTVVGEVETTV